MLNIKLTVLLSTELFISKCYCLAPRGKSKPKKKKVLMTLQVSEHFFLKYKPHNCIIQQ